MATSGASRSFDFDIELRDNTFHRFSSLMKRVSNICVCTWYVWVEMITDSCQPLCQRRDWLSRIKLRYDQLTNTIVFYIKIEEW